MGELRQYLQNPYVRYWDYYAEELCDPFITETDRLRSIEESKRHNINQMQILKLPLAFYGLASEPKMASSGSEIEILRWYVNDMVSTLCRAKQAIPNDLRNALVAMPLPVFRALRAWVGWQRARPLRLDEYEVPAELFSLIYDHLYYVYNLFTAGNRLDPQLEAMLTTQPEYCYLLLNSNHWLLQNEQSVWPMLLEHPVMALNWIRKSATLDKIAAYQELLHYMYQHREVNAWHAHCYHWLITINSSQDEKLAALASFLPVLSTNSHVAMITALEYPETDIGRLTTEVEKSPMWTYNWLRHTKLGMTPGMRKTLISCVPWAVQYVNDLHPPDAREILAELLQELHNKWWCDWLYAYIRNWQAGHPDASLLLQPLK